MARQNDAPVSKTFVRVDMTGGINAKQDSHQLQNGQLKTADNVVFGVVEGQITKRYGCAAIRPQGAPLQGGPFKSLGVRDNIEPLILGANTLNKYNVAQNLSTSLPTPTQGRLNVKQVAGSSGTSSQAYAPSSPSIASDNDKYIFATWHEPGSGTTSAAIFYGVQDIDTGSWIIAPRRFTTPVANRVVGTQTFTLSQILQPQARYYNGIFYLTYLWVGKTADNTLYDTYTTVNASALSLTNLAAGFGPNIFTMAVSQTTGNNGRLLPTNRPSAFYDSHFANGKFIIAAADTRIVLAVGTVDGAGLTTTKTQSETWSQQAGMIGFSVRCDGPSATPYSLARSSLVYFYTADMIRVTPFSIDGPMQYAPTDSMWVGSTLYVAGTFANTVVGSIGIYKITNAATGAASSLRAGSAGVSVFAQALSRMFLDPSTGKVNIWAASGGSASDSIYCNAYLLEFDFGVGTTATICRTFYQSIPRINVGDVAAPCDIVQVPKTSRYVTMVSQRTELTEDPRFSYGTLARTEFNLAPIRSSQLISLPTGGVMIAGGYPLYYDGNDVVEAGFSSTPTDADNSVFHTYAAPTISVASTGGIVGGASAVTTSGSLEYYYTICLVRRDAYGNAYRSAPSPIITVPCPNARNTVTFPPYYYNGGGNVMVEIYRSTQNNPGTYYFLATYPLQVSYVDSRADGSTTPSLNNSITKNRTVYTNSNELPNDPPPAVHHMAVSENRAYLIPADNRNVIWYSKQFSPGRTVEFSAGLTMSEGLNSGVFTALAVLDQNLIVFKEDQIVFTYGNGPDNGGSNGSFAPFARVATDVGCIDPASCVTIPDGILFRSRRGIELLNRSLQVTYVGAPIEPLLAKMGRLASAVVSPNFMQVRFVPQAADQPVLVYDYGHNRWSTFSKMAAVYAAPILGNYWWISQDGSKVFQETPDAYTDDGAPIVLTLETPEIPVGAGGVQGWGRAYRMALLGDFYSAHKLNVSFAYDHQTSYPDSVVFDTATGLVSGDTVYQFRCSRLPRSVMQTLRIKVTESGTVGQSCAISSLALEVGTKNGLAKLGAQKTV